MRLRTWMLGVADILQRASRALRGVLEGPVDHPEGDPPQKPLAARREAFLQRDTQPYWRACK